VGAIQQGDGTTIASELFVANADGSGVVQISDTPSVVEDFPVWAPDGMRIAYSTHRAGKICVAVLEAVQ
jgi:Tol biopolymer transport system component